MLKSSLVNMELNWEFRISDLLLASLYSRPTGFFKGATPEDSCLLLLMKDQNRLGFCLLSGLMMFVTVVGTGVVRRAGALCWEWWKHRHLAGRGKTTASSVRLARLGSV